MSLVAGRKISRFAGRAEADEFLPASALGPPPSISVTTSSAVPPANFEANIENTSNNNRQSNLLSPPQADTAFHHRRDALVIPKLSTSDDEKTKAKRYLRIVLPHVGLVTLSIMYTLIGGYLFYLIEHNNEKQQRQVGKAEIDNVTNWTIERLWQLARNTTTMLNDDDKENFTRETRLALGQLTKVLHHWFENKYVGLDDLKPNRTSEMMWTFPAAIFFSASTITTIGYGHLVPATDRGRMFCIVFGLFGIPLMLVTIADIGRFIGDGLVEFYCRTLAWRRRLRHWLSCRCRALGRGWRTRRRQRRRRQQQRRAASSSYSISTADQLSSADDELEDDEEEEEEESSDEPTPVDDGVGEVEGTVPLAWIFLIFVAYTALGGLLLRSYEADWGFWEAFYFSFITMSTVGFGDLVPQSQSHYALTLVYVAVGLTLTTMCIDLAGSYYIEKVHHFGRRIRSAQAALRTVGDLVRYTAFLRRRYGLDDSQMDHIVIDARHRLYFAPTAFTPHDIGRIYYIDQRTRAPSSTASSAHPSPSPRPPPPPPPHHSSSSARHPPLPPPLTRTTAAVTAAAGVEQLDDIRIIDQDDAAA